MKRRVAIIGMFKAGKTTLITSLIDHWLNHDLDKLPLQKNRPLLCRWKDQYSDGKRLFETNRQRFSTGKWPAKTLTPMSFQLKYRYANELLEREIELLDIPASD